LHVVGAGRSRSSGTDVLYVEDDPASARLVRKVLGERGGVVSIAVDGRDAMRLAAELHPRVILLDVRLPDMDGLTVLERLRADPATASIPVVALSASVTAEERERGLAAGVVAYLTKPLDVRLLLETLAPFLPERGPSG